MSSAHFMLFIGLTFSLFACSSDPTEQVVEQGAFTRRLVGPFAVDLPVTWKTIDVSTTKAGQGVPDLFGFQPPCTKEAAFCENVVIRLTAPSTDVTLPAMGTFLEEALKEKYAGYRLHSRRDTVIHRLPMAILDYAFTTHNLRLRSTAVLVQAPGRIAQFGFATTDGPEATSAQHCLLLQTIIASIRVR